MIPLPTTNGTRSTMTNTDLTKPIGPNYFNNHQIWSGFYKKALKERQQQLKLVFPHLFPPSTSSPNTPSAMSRTGSNASIKSLQQKIGEAPRSANADESVFVNEENGWPINGLDEEVANNMIENCIGTIGLPIGLALNFTINGIPMIIPMAVEEPSVVAAVSGAAKTISQFAESGGFVATCSERNVTFAQVQLLDIPDSRLDEAIQKLADRKKMLIDAGNRYIPNMVSRGGGVIDMEIRKVAKTKRPLRPREISQKTDSSYWLVIHFHIDVCDAMGANCASSIAEGVAPLMAELVDARVGVKIVSNLSTQRMAKTTFRIPTKHLEYKGFSGAEVAKRLVEAYQWAEDDPFRACTHNKGVMNGVDAVAIATGQDWRAIEAAAHAWGCGAGKADVSEQRYGSITKYWIEQSENGVDEVFCGELELPISVGTKGGVLNTHPVYQYSLGVMGNPNTKSLAISMACVGLAQNFAAMRALVTEGIQRGHMSLHARNIAIAAGAPPHAINECVAYMVESGRINLTAAHEYLQAHEIHIIIHKDLTSDIKTVAPNPPSMFYFQESRPAGAASKSASGEDRVTLNIAFQTLGKSPVNIELTESTKTTDTLVRELFGDKTHAWLMNTFGLLDSVKLNNSQHSRANYMLVRKLKFISILLNIITRRLIERYPMETKSFIDRIFGHVRHHESSSSLSRRNKKSSSTSTQSKSQKPSIELHLKAIRETGIALGSPCTSALTSPIDGADGDASLKNAAVLPPSLNLELKSVGEDVPRGTQWTLPDSGIFRRELLASVASPQDTSTPEIGNDKPTLLQVGLPLLLALWQVFELRVNQWVGKRLLANVLLEEQRRIISALVASSSAVPNLHDLYAEQHQHQPQPHHSLTETFSEFMSVHAKRFQMSLFLLCDAINFDPTLITENRLKFLLYLGAYLEWEQARMHDISKERIGRDTLLLKRYLESSTSQEGVAEMEMGPDVGYQKNSFLVWLVLFGDKSKLANVPNDSVGLYFQEELKRFILDTDLLVHREKLLNANEPKELFDKAMFEKVITGYRKYYGVN